MTDKQEEDQTIPLVESMIEIVKESISDSPLPDTGLPKENLESILWMLTVDILESLGAPDTEREFVLTSTVIAQVYLNTLQEIQISNLKEKLQG
jgi:hypothetical protein